MNGSQPNEGTSLSYYLSLISRRRWLIIAPFCLAMAIGIALAVKLPKVYEASTLILVTPQRVPEKIVQPVVSLDIEYRISTISQQIMSRSNLEKVIEKFQLFAAPELKDILMEDKLVDLRSRIKVDVSRSRSQRGADAFTISYRDRDPQLTMRVANGLTSFFIDENLKSRETQAVGTSDFLVAELESMRKRLESQEQELKNYRQRYMGELPEQLDSNLRILERLSAQVAEKEQSLRSARVSLGAMENEAAVRRSAAAMVPPTSPATGREGEDTVNLEPLKEKLENLRATYTDQHPDVIRLKVKIENLERQAATNPQSALSAQKSPPPASAELVRQRAVYDGTIRGLEIDIGRLNQEIREYQRRIDASFKREQELLTLKRDYDNIKGSYNSLLNRKLEADIGVNMERKQKGEQFQILDAAREPEKPVSPNLPRLFMIAVLAGLGLGGGMIFISDMIDTSIRRIDDLEKKFGVAVLATVPRIFSHQDKSRHRFKQMATTASIVMALILTSAFAILVINGVEPTLDLVRQYARV